MPSPVVLMVYLGAIPRGGYQQDRNTIKMLLILQLLIITLPAWCLVGAMVWSLTPWSLRAQAKEREEYNAISRRLRDNQMAATWELWARQDAKKVANERYIQEVLARDYSTL